MVLWYARGLNGFNLFHLFLTLRAKLFRGKKVQGEYDIRVEQVRYFTTVTDETDETITLKILLIFRLHFGHLE